ncbi:uncharacterized protein LOC125075862 [Vanessa atalanta]|uniref:uncharacterized protein LOC125066497 n=1 Tax=Vanessa atalanta TaxID=42275 RepID=UPI001FCCE661|nr:uncharacterized protein LOC125066497 [Vanessa atalanta]XP_047538351.1 uncharacterized protein LOC125071947 [Vanessa atalanta]XP_047539011.1 uncharacterized protein LOC125072427 [Vanessa atalanta]XP_047540526.1 uncharacterized protein LOC125073655 [Vanessa atalanta]XP_047541976.1 uncharacterized protein LOC125074642 [Vanessa atalanta]XP_047543636.1 uncharacterized protein LOC125075862 [Vanessa atalanta]
MDSIKDTLATMTELFNTRMNEFQQDLQKNSSPVTTSSLAADFSSFKKFILSALTTLQRQVEFLTRIIDRQEMKTRRKTLLFHGVPEEKSEDVSARVTSIVAENLNLANFSSASIKSSYRLGWSSGNKPRPIAVKFRDAAVRDKVWFAKTKLKGTSFTQSEFLTKTRHIAFLAARERFGVNRCWTRDGIIFVITSNGKRYRAECLADLDEIPGSVPSEALKSPVQNIAAGPITTECKTAASRSKRVIKK